MNPETRIQNSILRSVCRAGVRLFRNAVGVGWVGAPGRLSRVRFGLAVGSGDLIGWRTITVTEEMVGKKLAQFVSLEVKTDTGRLSEEQKQWLWVVENAGGLAKVVRSEEEAKKELQ